MREETRDTITWSQSASESTPGRLCLYLSVAFLGGLGVILLGAVASLAVYAIRSGEYQGLAIGVLLALVGGPFSVLYLLPLLSDQEGRASLLEAFGFDEYRRLRTPWIVVSAVLGAATMVGAAVHPLLLTFVFGGIPIVAFVGVGLFASEGTIDPESGTVTVYDQSFALENLEAFRVHRWNGMAFVRLQVVDEVTWLTIPGLVSMPWEAYADAEAVFEDALETDAEPSNPPSRVERIVLGVFAGGSLVGAGGALVAGLERSGDSRTGLFLLASFAAVFGLLFLVLTVRKP